jgi:hypothetical protein
VKGSEQQGGRRPLSIIQRWFQAVVTDPEGAGEGLLSPAAQEFITLRTEDLEQIILRSRNLDSLRRLSIYANAYYARLVECLAECFPVLRRAVGDEVFGSFAVAYLNRYPSRSYTLDRLGDNFSRFLDEVRPDRDEDGRLRDDAGWPDFLIDLATLEWAIAGVFDGPGVEKDRLLTAGDFQEIPPDRFARAKLVPVSCLRILEFKYPVNSYYTAAHAAADDETVEIPGPHREAVALTRRDYVVRRIPLDHEQKILLEGLQAGGRVGDLVAVLAEESALSDNELAEALRSWFHLWAAERLFQSVILDD